MIDWGDVTTWVGAVATVLALVASAFAARAYGTESRRDGVTDADRKAAVEGQQRSQVSKVVICLEDNLTFVGADLIFTDVNERRGPLGSVSLDSDPTNAFVGPM